jgi:hypothetical protein
MSAYSALRSANGRTSRQRSMRRRSSGLALGQAVRTAVNALFRFRYRATQARALWCGARHVWLGSETYLHWALCDAQIDIPWVVATSPDAPEGKDALRDAVCAELTAYWADKMASLPRRNRPRWLPLP